MRGDARWYPKYSVLARDFYVKNVEAVLIIIKISGDCFIGLQSPATTNKKLNAKFFYHFIKTLFASPDVFCETASCVSLKKEKEVN